MASTELERALAAVGPETPLEVSLFELEQEGLEAEAEVDALARAMDVYGYTPAAPPENGLSQSVMYSVCGLMQSNEKVSNDLVRAELVPRVLRLLEHHVVARDLESSEVLFALKVLSMYGVPEAIPFIARASRDPWSADGFLWSVVLQIYADEEHPHSRALVSTLADPLPSGFAAVAFLDLANTLVREQGLSPHPYDTSEGRALLQDWLSSSIPDEESFAASTTAALPFISSPAREELLALAMAHRSSDVRLEAAWAAAKLGDEAAVERLAQAALDIDLSERAVAYMVELGLDDHIPEKAMMPEFQARAGMAAWLAHPMELGRPPSWLVLFDSRELHWPPTNDRRQVYLFKYGYDDEGPDEPGDEGVGMVGSITFALFGEATADLSPAEIYALHCVWELQQSDDPRAPAERTIEAGLALLRVANPDDRDIQSSDRAAGL